jgi:hypothetical protein
MTSISSAAPPAPRYAIWWALLTYVLCTLALGYPALTGGFLVTPISDQYIGGFPLRDFAAQALKAGEGIPHWNPYIMGGLPYIAAMHGDIFYPTFLLRALLPTDVAMTWSFMIHMVLAGLFTYMFARAAGLGFWASLIGGIAYMMSGPIAGYVSPGHDGKLYVSTLLPLMLYFLIHGVRDGRLWAWGGLAITTGLGVLSPHPQLLQYMLLVGGFFGLYLAFGAWNGTQLQRSVAVQRLGIALAAVGIGFLMGAIQYAPVLDYVDWSPRAGGKDYAHAVSYSMPAEELVNAFVPQFSGILDNYWGRNGIHFHSDYAGVVVLLLAGLGLFAAAPKGRGFRWFWIATFAISLLLTLGGTTPFYRVIYELVPGTKYFRAPSTMMYVTMFSVAVFAALGAERVLGAPETIRKRFMWGWLGGIVALGLILASGLPAAVARMIGESQAAFYPPEQLQSVIDYYQERARANQPQVLAGSLRSVLFVAGAVGLLWLVVGGRISRGTAAIGMALWVAADLWTVERMYWRFSPPASQVYASDPAIDSVRAAQAPGRLISWDPLGTSAYRDPYFGGDAFMVHEVRMVAGYHGNELGRYQRVLDATAMGDPRRPCFCRPELWRHENVHWLYTTLPDSLMPAAVAQLGLPAGLQKVVGPVRNSVGSTVYLYRLPGENPLAWVASAVVKGTDDQALATVLDARFDPTRAAILDTGAAVQVPQLTGVPDPSGVRASVADYRPGRITLTLSDPAVDGTALVVSENFYPGWSATVDGRSIPTHRANFNLIGIVLPAGARSIELRFVDTSYGIGKTITFLALAIAVAGVVAGFVFDRRRRPAAAA